MPDENRQIQFDIQVSLSQAKNSLDELKLEIKKTKDEIYKAENGKSIFGVDQLRKHLEDLQNIQTSFQSRLHQDNMAGLKKEAEYRASMDAAELKRREAIAKADGEYRRKYSEVPADKQTNFRDTPQKQTGYSDPTRVAEIKQMFANLDAIEKTKERTAVASQKAETKAQEEGIKERSRLLQQDLTERQRKSSDFSKFLIEQNQKEINAELKAFEAYDRFISDAKRKQNIDTLKSEAKPVATNRADTQSMYNSLFGMESYTQQLSNIRKEQELLHQQWISSSKTLDGYKGKMKELSTSYSEVEKNLSNFNRSIGLSNTVLGNAMETVKRHMIWIGSGLAIGGLIAIPAMIDSIIIKTDSWTQKIKQNLELTQQYKDNMSQLNSDMGHLQNVASIYAVGYGAKVEEILESMSVLSRRFKDTDTITYLENLVLTIHKLDNVPIVETSQNLEAVILQFGLNAQQTRQFVNELSVAVHSARISGQELLDALQRSGSVFHQYGADTKEAIAVVSALATTTARTGSNIGNSWKSILSSTEKDKVQRAFDQLGISMYDDENKAKDLGVVFGEVMSKWSTFDQKTRNAFAKDWAGQFQLNALSSFFNDAFPVYEKLMKGLGGATDELTAKLLKTGLESYATKIDRLKASFEVLGMSIGNNLLPQLTAMANGLTAGVMYLNDHREAVSKTIEIIGQLGIALMAWRAKNVILSSSLVQAGLDIAGIYTKEGQYKSAMKVMGEATWGFAKTAIAACSAAMGRFLILYAAIEVAQEAYRQFSDKSGSYAEQATAQEQFNYAQYSLSQLEANKSRMTEEEYDTARKNLGDSIIESADRLNAANAKVKDMESSNLESELDGYYKKAQAIADAAQAKAKIDAGSGLESGGTSIEGLGSKPKNTKGKAEPMAPTDASFAENKLELKRYTKNLFNILDKNKSDYQEALEDLGTFTALYGENNVQAIRQRQQLEQGRILQIQQEQKAIEAQKAKIQSDVSDIINKYPEMKPIVNPRNPNVELPTEEGVDVANVKPAVKSAAASLIQEISSQLGVSPIVTSGYREGDPGGHGRGDKVDVGWEGLNWGTDEFNRAVSIAESKGFVVYAVPHGTGPHLDLNGSNLPELPEASTLALQSSGMTQELWQKMTTDERLKWRIDNKDELQNNSILSQALDQLDALIKKGNEKAKELAKMQAEITKAMFSGVFDEDKQRERRLKSIDSDETLSKLNVNKSNPMWSLDDNDVQLSSEMRRYTEYIAEQKKLKQDYKDTQDLEIAALETAVKDATTKESIAKATMLLEAARNGDTAALQKNTDAQQANQVKLAQSLEKQRELAESTSKTIKTFWADSFLDMANSGTKFKDIMKNLWSQIQKDAVYALAGIKGNNTSVASSMLGTVGKSGSKANARGIQGPSMANGLFYKNGKGGKHATGGVVNVPSIAGEDGEEVIVPTEKNTANSKKLLDYASSKLGYYPGASGDSYVPYFKNESLATSPVVNVQLQQNSEHIAELQTANKLMMQQNQMILQMLNNGTGRNSVVQPVVVGGGQMSDDELYNKINRMKSNGYDI